MLKVSELYIHPIKSLGGISLNSAEVTDRGLKHDRRWLLVDENNCFFTQRDFPRMTFLKTNITDDILEVSDKNNPINKIKIPIGKFSEEEVQVTIWNDTVTANVIDSKINKWFSNFLGIDCKLVYMPDITKREVSKEQARDNEIVSFADGFPFLIIGQSALDDLNRRLTTPVPITNFRPNIVFTGGNPFEEDNWSEIQIGKITYFAVKPCARCVITTIDQETAVKNKEPLATLSTYRRSGNKILFGENLIHQGTAQISVGDEIRIISHKKNFMIKKSIETTKTARYFLSGKFTEQTEKAIIACHGYGELAENFLKNFDLLDKDKIFIAAPEGLNRFYTKGFFGNVGASWMTKEDRLNDINDYVKFLDKIYNDEIELHSNRKIIKKAFGFSQGTATVCRWFINTTSKIDGLILWGSGIPNDIDLKEYKPKFNSVRLKILIGDKDPFITSEQIESEKRKLTDQGIDHELIVYEGGHKIKKEILKTLI